MRCMSVGYRGSAQFFYQGNDREKPQRRKLLIRAVGGKSFHSSTPLLSRAGGAGEVEQCFKKPRRSCAHSDCSQQFSGPRSSGTTHLRAESLHSLKGQGQARLGASGSDSSLTVCISTPVLTKSGKDQLCDRTLYLVGVCSPCYRTHSPLL